MTAPKNKWVFDQKKTQVQLAGFFAHQNRNLKKFGSTVNQTFEAFVFASTLQWYKDNGWKVFLELPIDKKTGKKVFRLKFNTRGKPQDYAYATAKKGNQRCQIHHQLRVSTRALKFNAGYRANICLDVAIIVKTDISRYKTDWAVPNQNLIAFGEAKHMSGYAELVAGFIGLVFELQPDRVGCGPCFTTRRWHLHPFLFVSGVLYPTGQGVYQTIRDRGFDMEVYTSAKGLSLRQQGS